MVEDNQDSTNTRTTRELTTLCFELYKNKH